MAIRGACTSLNTAGWESLKGRLLGDPGVWNLMSNSEEKYKLFGSQMDNSADKKAAVLFEMLKEPLAIEFKTWNIRLIGEKALDEACMELQAVRSAGVDESLNRIWRNNTGLRECVQKMGAFSKNTYPIGVPAIRSWMTSYEAGQCLRTITTLNLGGLFLTVFPEEISMCVRLEDLQLHANNFSSFPYDLNAWSNLKRCNLSANRLEYFLESTRSHPSLEMLDLSSNLLGTFSCNFNGYPALKWLYLHDNPFYRLSCALTPCRQLEELSLTTKYVKNFSFKLPSDLNLCRSLIVSMHIPGCNFSVPALRAESRYSLPLGSRLGVVIDLPVTDSTFLTWPYIFDNPRSTGWVGKIPVMNNFKFVAIDCNGKIQYEKRPEWRCPSITRWSRQESPVVVEDISFLDS